MIDVFGVEESGLDEISNAILSNRDIVDLVEVDQAMIEERPVIARDRVSEQLLAHTDSVAATPSTVLLLGESGVGKEVIARYIHRKSRRSDGPFVAVNCAALPPTLLESELFGHEKGAFSGAIQKHIGVFERANGGTILLDEVSEMPLELQAKLLRVLQERTLIRVGGSESIKVNIRIIATTNRDLKQYSEDGHFRMDLYYRLNVFPLRIPALRERPNDIEPIARFYLASFATRFQKTITGISRAAIDKLMSYAFPGNIRELINVLERAVILSGDSEIIEAEHLMLDESVELLASFRSELRPELGSKSAGMNLGDEDSLTFRAGERKLTDVRRMIIVKTLQRFDGNRTRTAEALGVSARTIRNKLNDYRDRGLPVPE